MYIDPKDKDLWKTDIKSYENSKKQRGYESPKHHIVTFKEIKATQQIFNPILQVFNKKQNEEKDFKDKKE